MDNFTPLKSVTKKKKVNLFLLANLFLVLIIVSLTTYYFKDKLFPTTPKAAGCTAKSSSKRCQQVVANQEKYGGYAGNYVDSGGNNSSSANFTNKNSAGNTIFTNGVGLGANHTEGQQCDVVADAPYCRAAGVGGLNYAHYSTCANGGGGAYCTVSGTNSSNQTDQQTTNPTDTPVPTATGTATGTPIPTATGTVTDTPVPTATGAVTPTGTIAPTSTGVPGATLTPVPVLCGTKDCDNKTNPCRSGYSCIQSSDGSNYCASPDFIPACKANPSYNTCCTAPGSATATPTEIVLAKTTVATSQSTPVTGSNSWYMFVFPALAIIGGLIL